MNQVLGGLKDKVILITGGASGIGLASAQVAAANGAKVVCADLEQDVLLLDWARELAPQMLERYPALAARHISRWLGGKAEYLKA